MNFNPLPFLFLPGTVLAGYLLCATPGVTLALAAWALLVAGATAWVGLRVSLQPRESGAR
jgi:hypothetical protein